MGSKLLLYNIIIPNPLNPKPLSGIYKAAFRPIETIKPAFG